jgi:hypothetical protein
MVITPIQFNDTALNEVAQRSAFQLSNFKNNLDQTSEDIKRLEKWLQTCGVCTYASVEITSESMLLEWSDHSGAEWRLVCRTPNPYPDYPEDEYEFRPLIEMPARARLICRPYLPKLLQGLAELLPKQEDMALAAKKSVAVPKASGKKASGSAEELFASAADEIAF